MAIHPIELAVALRPTDELTPAQVKISADNDVRLLTVDQLTTVTFSYTAEDSSTLTIELVDQQQQEGVEIVSITIFGIEDPKFAWAGVYEPKYPEPWATEQQDLGVVLKQHLSPHTYLSWPGKWRLTFTAPVFTWIHRVQNLGWIYD